MRTEFCYLPLCAALLFFATGCGPDPLDKHAAYDTFADAVADGASQRGWLPDFVPVSATDLRESHNLDTNRQWLGFRFDPVDLDRMQQVLTPVPLANVEFPDSRATRKRAWWPVTLQHSLPELEAQYDFFTYMSGGPQGNTGFVAIDKSQPLAYYWTSDT
jgi:hypothetical protein